MKIVFVTGTRSELSVDEKYFIDEKIREQIPNLICHGDCPTGVDAYVGKYSDITCVPFPAKWNDFGKRAGTIRNADMATIAKLMHFYGNDVVCLGFPRGLEWSGTRHCMQQMEKYVPVIEFVL